MTATEKILSDIGVIYTLIENFPDSFFDFEGAPYTNGFDFLLDVLRACGINEQAIINFIVAEVYGVYNETGEANWYTLEGLAENLARSNIKVNETNRWIDTLENGIKVILMGMFTSLFTCSALPVLPNRVFDLTTYHLSGDTSSGAYLMPPLIQNMTTENGIIGASNDANFKIKIPIGSIDALGLLSISPVSPYGRLYYNVSGGTDFYQKISTKKIELKPSIKSVLSGETYINSGYNYTEQIHLVMNNAGNNLWSFTINLPNNQILENKLKIKLKMANSKGIFTTETFKIEPNETTSNTKEIKESDKYTIKEITLNGHVNQGGISLAYGNSYIDAWIYSDENTFNAWTGNKKLKEYGGVNWTTGFTQYIATANTNVEYLEEVETGCFEYQKIDEAPNGKYFTYTYVPGSDVITENSPEFIGVYNGVNPNLLYQTCDMNAFIWYVINRGKKTNQEEENHLMWDSRNIVYKKSENEYWFPNSEWWGSKKSEGEEFKNEDGYTYYDNQSSYYPIIQLERYDRNASNMLLLRFPAQRYFAPKKRQKMDEPGATINSISDRLYFNSSVYKFDWEYLQSINILNIKFLLARFIENITGNVLDSARNIRFNYWNRIILGKLRKAIKNIIAADDMEIEDCYNTFSNEDFDELLEEMFYEKYTATKYNGESKKARIHNMDNYAVELDSINDGATQSGTISRTQKLVTDVLVTEGEDSYIENMYDGNLLEKLCESIVIGIVESLFTPQVMLLAAINYDLMGLGSLENIMTSLMNNLLRLVANIVKAVKDLINYILLNLIIENIIPILKMMALLLFLEKLTNWLVVLLDAVKCITLMTVNVGFDYYRDGRIDEVNYADIVNNNALPESQSSC